MSTTIRPVLDVVVPVYNEQAGLTACVQRLTAHLETNFPYPWRVTVADNASTDTTLDVARLLGIPDDVTQAGLFPVAYTKGTDFKEASRLPAAQLIHWDRW